MPERTPEERRALLAQDARRQHFRTYQQWVNKASSWLTAHPDWHETRYRAICFDAKGRHCQIGRDFMRARDEGTFPVFWLWPNQIAEMLGPEMAALLAQPAPSETEGRE